MLIGTLGLAGLTGWAVATGQPLPLVAFLGTATVVGAVGASEVVAEVASWYDVLQSAVLGLFGVGLLLLGYGSALVVGLTAAFVCTGLVAAVQYRRSRRTVPPQEENAP
jgi:Mn2+/Fe2+ NRAMP family transporter